MPDTIYQNNNSNANGLIIVLSGPSGVGKDTIANVIKNRFPLSSPHSYTTRPPRQSVDDYNYIFISEAEFDEKSSDMIAVTESHGYRYGICKHELDADIAAGKIILKVLDMYGADEMKSLYGDMCLTIFLLPPSIAELERRLTNRKTENCEMFKKRMNDSIIELRTFQKHRFDEKIYVYDVNQASGAISDVIEKYINIHRN